MSALGLPDARQLGYAPDAFALRLEPFMKLTSCPRCERHVLVESSACPFCGTRLGTTSALGRAMMIAVVGLSMSCGGGDDTTETTVASDPTQGATTQGDTTQGDTTINAATDSGGADYAGPGTDAGYFTSSSGGTDTETDTDTDTDTGDSSSGTPATDSGGADYAGPGTTSG